MNAASNAGFVEMREECVALRNAEGVDVINMLPPFCFARRDDRLKLSKGFVVLCGVLAAERIPAVQLPQLHLEHGSLDSIHATIPADHAVVILSRLAVIAKDTNFFIDPGVVCHHPSGFAEGSEVLAWVKAEAAGVAQRASFSPFVFRTVSLGGTLYAKSGGALTLTVNTSSDAKWTALPAVCSERDPIVPVPRGVPAFRPLYSAP